MTTRRILLSLLWLISAFVSASAAFGQVLITSPSPLPQGYAQIPYTYTFTAVESPAGVPITWSVMPGPSTNLPSGFNLSANGTFYGTTTEYGIFTFPVTAQAGSFSTTQTFTLVLVNPTITVTSPPNLGNAFVGQPYSLSLTALSNPAGFTPSNPSGLAWSLSSGAVLPPGLSLSPSGVISGNPKTIGTYSFLVNVQIAGTTITTNQNFTLTVYAGQTTIQTTSLPLAALGAPYSATLSGGPTGITWTVTGMLPVGITFNPTTGVFAGSTIEPSEMGGIYPIQVQANLPNYLSATQALTLYVTSGPLAFVPAALPPAVQGSPYTATVTASGGLPPYQWSIGSASTLGLSINSLNGIITGTPKTSGNLLLPVILSDATGLSIQQNLSLFVANPLSVATTSLANGSIGTGYTQTLAAGGGQSPYTWVVTAGSLPPGLALSPTGAITGTPTANGSFHFTVQVTDAGGRTATAALTLSTGVAPLSITTSSLPYGQLTVPYSQTLAASGGVAPYTWTLISGTLPPGLKLNSNGTIAGTPAGPLGISSFAVQVTDSSPPPALTAQKAFTINIALTLTITTLTLPGGSVNVPYSQTLAGSGGTPPYIWSISAGALPPGLQLNATTGVISGTPTSTGPNLFTVTLTDSTGLTAPPQQLNITITTLSISSSKTLSITYGAAFSQTLTATGGTPPYTWSIASGTLPTGLQLSSSSGVISGTPTAAGTPTVTVRVTDSQGQTATQVLTFAVSPLSITSSNTLSVTYGAAFSQTLTPAGGTSPYTWSIASGTLPTGLQLSSNGVISGTPTAAGTPTVTVKVTDSQGQTATQVLTITVSLPPTPALTIGTIPGTPATQPLVTLALASPFPMALTGSLSVSFQSAVGGNSD